MAMGLVRNALNWQNDGHSLNLPQYWVVTEEMVWIQSEDTSSG